MQEHRSDFWIEVEKCVEAPLQLALDLLPGSFNGVHRHVSLMAICELESGVVDLSDLALRQQPQSINQSQFCHVYHLIDWREGKAAFDAFERSRSTAEAQLKSCGKLYRLRRLQSSG